MAEKQYGEIIQHTATEFTVNRLQRSSGQHCKSNGIREQALSSCVSRSIAPRQKLEVKFYELKQITIFTSKIGVVAGLVSGPLWKTVSQKSRPRKSPSVQQKFEPAGRFRKNRPAADFARSMKGPNSQSVRRNRYKVGVPRILMESLALVSVFTLKRVLFTSCFSTFVPNR